MTRIKSKEDFMKWFFSFLIPPLGVILGGGTFKEFLINLLLTLCFDIPGIIHAVYICYKYK